MADAGDLQHLELVVLADAREHDAVVDLADLEQRARRVLGDDDDAVGRLRARRGCGRGRCPCGRSRPGPSSPARATRRRASSLPRALLSPAELRVGPSLDVVVGERCGTRRRRSPRPSGRCGARGRGRRWRRPRRRRRTATAAARSTASSRLMPSRHERLDPVLGVHAAGSVGLEVALLVPAAGDVVAEHAAAARGARRSRRTAARRSGPASRRAGCARTICASWLALPSSERVSPSIFS